MADRAYAEFYAESDANPRSGDLAMKGKEDWEEFRDTVIMMDRDKLAKFRSMFKGTAYQDQRLDPRHLTPSGVRRF